MNLRYRVVAIYQNEPVWITKQIGIFDDEVDAVLAKERFTKNERDFNFDRCDIIEENTGEAA